MNYRSEGQTWGGITLPCADFEGRVWEAFDLTFLRRLEIKGTKKKKTTNGSLDSVRGLQTEFLQLGNSFSLSKSWGGECYKIGLNYLHAPSTTWLWVGVRWLKVLVFRVMHAINFTGAKIQAQHLQLQVAPAKIFAGTQHIWKFLSLC